MESQETKKARELAVFDTLREAWRLTYGAKWAILAPYLCIVLVEILAMMAVSIGAGLLREMGLSVGAITLIGLAVGIAFGLVVLYFVMGLMAGITKVSIERGRGNPVTGKSGFHSFSRVIPLLLTTICFVICLLPGILFPRPIQLIYQIAIFPFLYLSIPFSVDKINSPFEAITRSFKAARGNWLKFIALFIMVGVIAAIFLLPLLLGVLFSSVGLRAVGLFFFYFVCVWLLPFIVIIQGVVYHKLAD